MNTIGQMNYPGFLDPSLLNTLTPQEAVKQVGGYHPEGDYEDAYTTETSHGTTYACASLRNSTTLVRISILASTTPTTTIKATRVKEKNLNNVNAIKSNLLDPSLLETLTTQEAVKQVGGDTAQDYEDKYTTEEDKGITYACVPRRNSTGTLRVSILASTTPTITLSTTRVKEKNKN